MRYLVIACNIMRDELLRYEADGISFVFLEQSLHRTPQKMKPTIQAEIDKAEEQDWDYIILSYGLCSNGILGVKSKNHSMVIPRIHDCIALFLGSWEKYMEEHHKEPGTYYLTKGWIEEGKSPIGIFQEYCQRYDKETAEWVIREELKNYTRIVLVEMGAESEALRDHAKKNADFFHLRYEEMKGSLEFFEKMLQGSWANNFIILRPGEEVKQELFFDL
jgi:hypothetical protein